MRGLAAIQKLAMESPRCVHELNGPLPKAGTDTYLLEQWERESKTIVTGLPT